MTPIRAVINASWRKPFFSLHNALEVAGIKTHSVTGRVKTKESYLEKLDREGYADPESDVEDIVGLRVVCLFLSDMSRVETAVRKVFAVTDVVDKVDTETPDTFGYMSIHYVCTLPPEHAGPRYDDLKPPKFEVQVRTILMDAWANVSHHLAYKGDASVPPQLRRDFFALSGLFYVADQHFELFFKETVRTQSEAQEALQKDEAEDLDLNLETAIALLRELYPDRNAGSRESISDFVQEAVRAGYVTVGTLRDSLRSGTARALNYEKDYPPSGPGSTRQFADVGLARQALAIADPKYAADVYRNDVHARYR